MLPWVRFAADISKASPTHNPLENLQKIYCWVWCGICCRFSAVENRKKPSFISLCSHGNAALVLRWSLCARLMTFCHMIAAASTEGDTFFFLFSLNCRFCCKSTGNWQQNPQHIGLVVLLPYWTQWWKSTTNLLPLQSETDRLKKMHCMS